MAAGDRNEIDVARPGDPYPWVGLFRRIEGLLADHDNVLKIEPEVVPIIFVPGILGSRLRTADERVKAWDPDDPVSLFKNYAVVNPRHYRAILASRKKLLLGEGAAYSAEHLVVDTDDEVHNGKHFADLPHAVERGWGGVSWGNYGAILRALDQPPHAVIEPVRHCVELPVHAFGYDWTAPLDTTAAKLADYVRETRDAYRAANPNRACDHVILVTHSMGGLVSRSALQELGTQTVLGAIHCGQPAAGAASAYWRMKGGLEQPPEETTKLIEYWRHPREMIKEKLTGTLRARAAAMVMGLNGESITSLLANMPGALHLLPTAHYTDAQGRAQWLRYPDADGGEVAFPRADPYAEIYRERDKFYRLVEEAWLLPTQAQIDDDARRDELNNGLPSGPTTAWRKYLGYLSSAERFHLDLGTDTHHPLTVQMYGWAQPTADRIGYTRVLDASVTDLMRRMGRRLRGIDPMKEGKKQATDVVLEEVKELRKELLDFRWFGVAFDAAGFVFDPSGTKLLRRIGRRIAKSIAGEHPAVANIGGYRVHTDAQDRPADFKRTWLASRGGQTPPPVYLMTLERLDTRLGDGTVARSSATALDAWREASVTGMDEVRTLSSHDQLYNTQTVQRATFRAVINLCLRKIEQVLDGVPPDPPVPPPPPPPSPMETLPETPAVPERAPAPSLRPRPAPPFGGFGGGTGGGGGAGGRWRGFGGGGFGGGGAGGKW